VFPGATCPPAETSPAWVAEGLPVETHESCLSLAEEMDRVLTTGVVAPNFEHGISIADLTDSDLIDAEPASDVAVTASKLSPVAEEATASAGCEVTTETWDVVEASVAAGPAAEVQEHSDQAGDAEGLPVYHDITSAQGTAEDAAANLSASEIVATSVTAATMPIPSSERELADADGVVGTSVSAAEPPAETEDEIIAAAVRKAETAVAAELSQPVASLTYASEMGTAVIESIVNRVLEQLKPKLVAEIARELAEKK